MTGVGVPGPVTKLTDPVDWENAVQTFGRSGIVGVYGSTSLQPSLQAGSRTVTLQPGAVRTPRTVLTTTTSTIVSLPASPTSNTYDRLVCRLDRSGATDAAYTSFTVLQGQGGGALPDLARDSRFYDVAICSYRRLTTGAIDSFVDERQWQAADVVPCQSGQRPTNNPGRVILEMDTKRGYFGDGTSWTLFAQASPVWTAIPLNTAFSKGAYDQPQYTVRPGSVVELRGQVRKVQGDMNGADIVGQLPVGARPPRANGILTRVLGFSQGTPVTSRDVGLNIYPDGSLQPILAAASDTVTYLSLDGVSFSAA